MTTSRNHFSYSIKVKLDCQEQEQLLTSVASFDQHF